MPLPTVFLERMAADLGQQFQEFLAALDAPPPVSLRLNPAKSAGLFAGAEPVPWHPQGRYLPERPVFTLDPSLHAGGYYVQEASSMLVYEAVRQTVGLGQDIRALDLCASPGGKSTLLLSALGEGGFLLANEAIQGRVGALRQNLERWGHPNYAVSNHDPEDFAKLEGWFDLVLVDAPCSGEGLFRKDEAAAAEWSPANVGLCAARQRRILTAAMALVKPGGVLLYSTCTFNAEENESNVAWLLGQGFEYLPLDLDPDWGVVERKLGYQCYPHRVRGEGFFMACLRQNGGRAAAPPSAKPPSDWQRLTTKLWPSASDWLSHSADYELFAKPSGESVAVRSDLSESFFTVGNALRRRSLGVELGELKRQELVPSHALALSTVLSPELQRVELPKEAALHYLKKENTWQPDWERGWTIPTFQGLTLGWLKVLDNRSNNYLPMDWRIKMDLKGSGK